MSTAINLVVDQALALTAPERSDIIEKLLASLDRPDIIVMPYGDRRQVHVSRPMKMAQFKLYRYARCLRNTRSREHFISY